MTTTTYVIRSIPDVAFPGISILKQISGDTPSPWSVIMPRHQADVYIEGITFQTTWNAGNDSTNQFTVDIGFGDVSKANVVIQLPYSVRTDTNVGYYMDTKNTFLPEPMLVPQNTQVVVRFSVSTGVLVSINGIRLRLQSNNNLLQPGNKSAPENFMNVGLGEKAFN